MMASKNMEQNQVPTSVSIHDDGAAVIKGHNIDIREGGALLIRGENINIREGGAAAIVGKTIHIQEGGGGLLVANQAELNKGTVLLAVGKIGGNAKVIFDFKAALLFGLLVGLAVALARVFLPRQ